MKDGFEDMVQALIAVRPDAAGGSFVNLPLTTPGGSSTTIHVYRILNFAGEPKKYHISDIGFAYRESESMGIQDKYTAFAKQIAEREEICFSEKVFSLSDIPEEQLIGAISLVANACHEALILANNELAPS